ncbi:MAG: tRNA (N6-isopentenyl adenosine(37)-C2)-methylthiotransferase MiaB [Verrucomicrobiota bacterium]
MPKVYIKTYGCQMNVRDSEQVAQMFVERGYTMTPTDEDADVVLVNTCSVRDQAEQKALGKMRHMARLQKRRPHMVYGFMGCMAQSRGPSLTQDLGHVNLVVGTQKYHKVVDHVDDLLRRDEEARMDDPRFSIVDVDEESESQNTIRDHLLKHFQATAYVSIMQGCNMKCTFCIVPYTRGGERGRPIPEIVDEVRRLADQGVREVTLLGQIVNLYGRHEFPRVDDKSPFVQLLEAVHEVEGIDRIRFTSPHPIGYKEDLITAFSYLPKLASHVHLPLQSGSDRILRLMHRPYKAEKFRDLCARIRSARDGIALSTDVIVGFPGETEADFEATKQLVREVSFDHAFVFRYSKRKDTPAAEMEDAVQLSERVKEERNQELLAVVDELTREKNERFVGRTVEVLCEGPSKTNAERLSGRTSCNRIVVFEGNVERHAGQLLQLKIRESSGFTLYGDLVLTD